MDGHQSKARVFNFTIVQKTKKANLFCNATLQCV